MPYFFCQFDKMINMNRHIFTFIMLLSVFISLCSGQPESLIYSDNIFAEGNEFRYFYIKNIRVNDVFLVA